MHVLANSPQPARDADALLTVTAVSKAYGAVRALHEASMSVGPGEVLGICGHNGAGKSTLVKVVTGVIQPDSGELRIGGEEVHLGSARDAQRHGIAHVDQELTIVPALSVVDNLQLGDVRAPLIRRRVDRKEIGELLATVGLSHVDPGQPASSLSLGERQLLEIARGFSRDCRILVLDEPTATLTRVEIQRVFDAIAGLTAQGAAVLFISHRLDEVLELCDRVMVMRDGEVVGTHSIGELDRHRLVGLILGEQGADTAPDRTPSEPPDAAPILEVQDLATPSTVDPVSFPVVAGRIVGLAGQLGSGNNGVLAALGGLEPSARGTVRLRGRPVPLGNPTRVARAGMAFVSGDRKKSGLYLTRSIAENLVATRMRTIATAGYLSSAVVRRTAQRLADIVGVDRDRVSAWVEQLSGGNQQKVLIGRGLDMAQTKVLLLDEPTRGVDVGGRADIHRLIRQFADDGGAVVFSSTELSELLELADDLVVFREGRVVATRSASEWTEGELLTYMTSDAGAEAPK